ncbi:ribosomal protein L15 [Russula earlei]|uniref:Ribosomal protein L15 n=1 Tax=Russula earlei TaxID=71964 RepID=A0ACC0U7D2_9AGAM|nr:ribosomal protein L15 [Russula earlei]
MSAAGASSTRVHLFNLHPSIGSRHTQKRLGRGRSSGLGKTSGRGHKGQKARSGNGKPKAGFEGGQTTISKLFPKKGFTNSINGKTYAPVNLDRIAHWIEQGRLTSSSEKPITARELLLGDGAEHLKVPIHITPSRASKKLGGTVFCRYYNRLSLYDCVKGRTDRVDAAPTRRQDIEWYTNWKKRGYLAPESIARMPIVQERWRQLSEQLTRYKKEEFAKR